MRVVVQRSKEAQVSVDGQVIGRIDHGLVVLVGVGRGDSDEDVQYLAEKVAHLRLFEDEEGKMNRSLLDVQGAVLSISQFTLYGDCRKGRRPSFKEAAAPEEAVVLYEQFNEALRAKGIEVATGEFGAMMQVQLINDGPVTLIIDSKER